MAEDNSLCHYDPQINPGSPLTPIPSTPTVLTPRNSIVLTFPVVSPTTTITLRNPNLGNSEISQMKRVVNTTRGNTVRWYRPQNWPKARMRAYTFTGISRTLADSLIAFLYASAGKPVGLLDYESQQWTGLITNPDTVITEALQDCGYTFELRFEGSVA